MHKLILYLLLLSTTIFAQIVDFKKALTETIKNSEHIKQQQIQIQQVNLDIKKVKQSSYGSINLIHEVSRTNHAGHVFNSKLSSREASFKDFGFSQFGQPIDTKPTDLNYPESRNNFNTRITYNIPLFTGFKLSNQKDILSLQKKAEQLKLNKNTNNLSLEVLKAYNNAVVAKMFLKAANEAKKAISKYEETAFEFYKEGLVTKIDKKQAEVKKLNINSTLINAKNNFELALAYLTYLTEIENISDVNDLKTYNIKTTENKLFKTALENRDEVKIINTSNSLYKKNIALNKSSYYPKVYSHLEYGVNDDKITSNDDKDYYIALVGIKLSLLDSSREYELEKSRLDYKKSLLQKENLLKSIKLETKKALLNTKAKEKILKEKFKAKELAYEVLEQSKLLYKNQLIAMSELLKQESIFRQTHAEYIFAQYEKSLANAQLILAMGNNLFEGNK